MSDAPLIAEYRRLPLRGVLVKLLRSDSVRNLIWAYYGVWILWGLFGTFWAYPIDLIVNPMGIDVYDMWIWSQIIAPSAALIGLYLRHGGSPADDIHGPLLRRDFLGLCMQVGGHGWMTVVLAVYVGTGIYAAQPRQPIISVFCLSMYLIGVLFLTAQCVYKIRLGKRIRKAIE